MFYRLFTAVIVSMGLLSPAVAQSAADISGKVVLANLDRYDAYLRVGKTKREIKPKKASVLSPTTYPVTIEFWSGNTQAGWRKQTISKAGIYGFNFKGGNWSLTELTKGTTPRPTTRPSSKTVRRRIVSQPTRRLPINADRNRWSPLARAAYAAGNIYQFVRDEQGRDLLRHLLIRAREDEDYDRLEDWIRDAKIPELYKHDLRDAFEDLGRLSDADWKEIDTADEEDWDQARADVGDLISDSDWSKPGVASGATGAATGDIAIVPRVHLHRPWARGFIRLPNSAARFTVPADPPRAMGESIRYFHNEFALSNGYSKWCMGAGWAAFDRHFVIWAENNGYEMDFITQEDLHDNADILNGYKCLVTVGHDEYYTWEMRKTMDRWMEAGGHFARFAGNLNWQIRLEDEGLSQVCYKGFARAHDPVRNDPLRRHLLTTMWEHPHINYGGAKTFASSSAFGHLIGLGGAAPRTPGFTVYRPDHWMLEGSDLYYGDAFAADYCRFECDGVPYTFRDGRPYPTDEFGTPTNIEIVGLCPSMNREEDHGHSSVVIAQEGYGLGIPQDLYNTDTPTKEQIKKHLQGCGILAYMPKGKGDVATAAVNEWVMGLGKDEFVDQITHNVLKRFTV